MPKYIFPTNLRVSSGYGPRGGGFHSGVDFSDGIAGHPIRAVADGTVTYRAYEPGGAGNTVTITHDDGIKSGYMHMREQAIVNVGQRVQQGQVIGYVGNTGASTGPHLHLWMGQTPTTGSFDPLTVLGQGTGNSGDPDEMTEDQKQELGRWMKEQRELTTQHIDKVVDERIGQWLKDTENRIVDRLVKELKK